MEFKDRVANKPNRVKITYEDSGASAYATVEMADEPIENGTPLNKATFDAMQKELLGFKRELTSSEDLNSLVDDGVYFYTTATVQAGLGNAPFENAAVVMVFGGTSKTTQKIQIAFRYGEAGHGKFRALFNNNWQQWADFTPAFEDEDYKGCFYRFVDGEKEWKNPPMEPEREYRTTERYEGNPVYVKRFFEPMPIANNTYTKKHYISGIGGGKTRIVSVEALATPPYGITEEIPYYYIQQFPLFSNNGELVAKIYMTSTDIRVINFSDENLNYRWEAIIKYIKV